MSDWTPDEEHYLRTHYGRTSLTLLAAHLSRSIKAIRSKAKVLKVQRDGRHVWTAEQEQYLKDRYADTLTKDIALHLEMPLHKVYKKAKRMGLSKPEEYLKDPVTRCRLQKGSSVGEAYRFPKDHVPANKGLRRPGYAPGRMKETQFKKGVLNGTAAQLYRPIGTILADHEGYLRVKVREHDENTRGWRKEVWPLLHHKVWTEANGPIPEKHIVTFKDKDRNNCDLENLECISMAENAARNCMWTNYPRELAEVIQLTGVLKRKLRKTSNAEKE